MNNFILKEYLDEHFSTVVFADIVDHFIQKFGVNVSNEDDLYLFKYNQISANWNEEITHNCRGIILRHTENGWKYVAIPFKKFFNLEEGKCKYFDENVFSENAEFIKYSEKIDGSCVQVWYDDVKNTWRASTLGSISTAGVFDHPFTFAELFWKIFGKKNTAKLVKGYTYIFELWSKYNQVVTQYETERIVLLGIRNNDTFSLKDFVLEIVINELDGIFLPMMFELPTIKTKMDLTVWVEGMAMREDLFGKVPEGFVAWLDAPIFKKKNNKYCQYHRIVTGDKIYVLKNIISAVFCGNIDDVYGDLNSDLQGFVDRLRIEISKVQGTIASTFTQFKNISIEDKKSYALKVNELADSIKEVSRVRPFYFYNREKIINGEFVDVAEWLAQDERYLKDLDIWKAV